MAQTFFFEVFEDGAQAVMDDHTIDASNVVTAVRKVAIAIKGNKKPGKRFPEQLTIRLRKIGNRS